MLTLLILVFLQCLLLVGAQTFMKISLGMWGDMSWSWPCVKMMLSTWQFAAAGICAAGAIAIWIYLLKRYPFSLAYTLQCISYIIGMFAARFVLGEAIPATRWIGAVIIMIGVFFMVLK